MCVTFEVLSGFIEQLLGVKPGVTEDEEGLSFFFGRGSAMAHVAIYPFDLYINPSLTVESADIVLTFCEEGDEPLNLDRLDKNRLSDIVALLISTSMWGKVEAQRLTKDTSVLVHTRRIMLQAKDLESESGDVLLTALAQELGLLCEEWLALNNLFSTAYSHVGEQMGQKVELVLSPCEGTA